MIVRIKLPPSVRRDIVYRKITVDGREVVSGMPVNQPDISLSILGAEKIDLIDVDKTGYEVVVDSGAFDHFDYERVDVPKTLAIMDEAKAPEVPKATPKAPEVKAPEVKATPSAPAPDKKGL